MNWTILLVTFTILLSSCVMRTFDSAEKGLDHAQNKATNAQNYTDRPPAEYRTRPRPNLHPIEAPKGPSWLRRQVANPVAVASIPFDVAVEEILAGTGVVAKFSYDVHTALPVSIIHKKGSVQTALEKIAARTNYAYVAHEHSVEWHAYVTETFSIPILAGDYSYMIGKEDQQESANQAGAGGEGQVDTSGFDVDRKQYSNLKGHNVNPLKETGEMLKSMVGKGGIVEVHEGASQILVKTTPDKMSSVRTYVDNLIAELTSQVRLELQIVMVTTKRGAEAGVNWAAVKEITDGQIDFVGESTLGRFTNAVPVAFSASKTFGGSDTVDLLFSALEQQGDASFVTEMHTQSSSGTMAEMELGEIEAYLAKVSSTSTVDVGITQELIPGFIQSGDTLYTFNKIFGDKVAMAISTRSSDLEPLARVGTEDNFIQLPKMRNSRFNVQQIVRSGMTVVAASISREEHIKNKQRRNSNDDFN